jgi:hypothetical protein
MNLPTLKELAYSPWNWIDRSGVTAARVESVHDYIGTFYLLPAETPGSIMIFSVESLTEVLWVAQPGPYTDVYQADGVRSYKPPGVSSLEDWQEWALRQARFDLKPAEESLPS